MKYSATKNVMKRATGRPTLNASVRNSHWPKRPPASGRCCHCVADSAASGTGGPGDDAARDDRGVAMDGENTARVRELQAQLRGFLGCEWREELGLANAQRVGRALPGARDFPEHPFEQHDAGHDGPARKVPGENGMPFGHAEALIHG